MSAKLNIFITGATGYIGGSVLARLLKHTNAASFEITALVRSSDKAGKLHTLGVKTVLGSYTDKDLGFLTEAASKADVVFSIADADNLPASQAILDGLKLHHEKTRKVPILIHTSGSAIASGDARGLHANYRTYSDLESEALNALPVTVVHRDVDIPIIEADKAGHVKAYLITPGTVFGYPSGPLVDLGIQNTHSVQLPYTIKPSIARKQGAYTGKGLNTWPAVNIDDTADLYIILFDAVLSNFAVAGHGPDGYYFVENCEYTGLEVGQKISETLFELGVATTREPRAFSQEELDTFYGALWPLLATNCGAKGDRARALGWAPKHGKEDFLTNIKEEVAFYLTLLTNTAPSATSKTASFVEIVIFKASEALLGNCTLADPVLQYYKNAYGCSSVVHGFEAEDNTKKYIIITWNSFESSEKLKQKDYAPLLKLAVGTISFQHVEFDVDTTNAFTAPVTEIATIKAREGHTQQDVSIGISRLRDNQHLAKGGRPPLAWAQSKETPELSTLIIGWDSIEAHAASYTVAPFDKITQALVSICEPVAQHVALASI